jgi:hypothetical protein
MERRTSSPEVRYLLLLPEQRSDTTLNFQPRGEIRAAASRAEVRYNSELAAQEQIRPAASRALLLPEQR